VTDLTSQSFSAEEKMRLTATVLRTFTPGKPVSRLDLLAGREHQISKVLEAVFSPGQHAAIYGERGVGKSSLANLVYDMASAAGKEIFIPVQINCSTMISFHEIWQEIFRQVQVASSMGDIALDQQVSDAPNSEQIRQIFLQVGSHSIIVLDEFDRIDQTTSVAMSDTIKTLSDRAVDTTLVLVGVGDSVDQLIQEHKSIERALIQIPMPRMSQSELVAIVTKGMVRLPELKIEKGLDLRMANISKGLPHFTHLLAKHAALSAIHSDRSVITGKDYEIALKNATEEKSQTLGQAYRTATRSSKQSIFEEVLLACALATDENGFFGAKDVRAPLSRILNKPVKIEAYIRHLDKFSQPERGPILKKDGMKRRFEYSFVEPMMQPHVLMKGLADNKITEEQLSVLSNPAAGSDLLFGPRS
jgi:Cdc6-like AAA superfamily ATPase